MMVHVYHIFMDMILQIFYDSTANTDDGSCIYCDISFTQFVFNQNTLGNCDGWILTNSHLLILQLYSLE